MVHRAAFSRKLRASAADDARGGVARTRTTLRGGVKREGVMAVCVVWGCRWDFGFCDWGFKRLRCIWGFANLKP